MDERIEQLRKKLREDPSSREFFKLGEALRRDGRLDEAARVLAEGLGHHPRYVAAWVALGRVELARNRFEQAETACARALDVDPENAVAARLIGEAASRRGDWKRALAAWRLALALAPGDDELEKRVAAAEGVLAAPEDGKRAPDREEPAVGPEVPPVPGPGEATAPTAARELPREVFALDEGTDPFAVEVRGDTGVWATGEDVFFAGEALESEPEAPPGPFREGFGPAPGEAAGPVPAAPEPVFEPGPTSEPEEGPVPGSEPVSTVGPAPPPGSAAVEVSEPETPVGAETPPSGLPLPTVTLARLALEQGDRELARQTLEQVVALRGESDETRALAREMEAAGEHAAGGSVARRKIERLQGWMRAVRLAAESHGHGV